MWSPWHVWLISPDPERLSECRTFWQCGRFPGPESVWLLWTVNLNLANPHKKFAPFRSQPPNLVSESVWFFILLFWSYGGKVTDTPSWHSQRLCLAEESTDIKTECLPHDNIGLSIWTLLFIGACLRYSQGNWKESYDWKGAPGFIWDHWVTKAQDGRNHVILSTWFPEGPPTPSH